MRRPKLAILLAIASMSCTGLNTNTPLGALGGNNCTGGQCYTQEKCQSLRGKYRIWGGVAAGSAALAGGGGLSAALPDNEDTRLGLGIGSAAVALLGAVSVYLRDDVTHEYSDYCTGPKPST